MPSADRFDKKFMFSPSRGENFIEYYVDGIRYQTITPDDVDGEWVFNQYCDGVALGGTL